MYLSFQNMEFVKKTMIKMNKDLFVTTGTISALFWADSRVTAPWVLSQDLGFFGLILGSWVFFLIFREILGLLGIGGHQPNNDQSLRN